MIRQEESPRVIADGGQKVFNFSPVEAHSECHKVEHGRRARHGQVYPRRLKLHIQDDRESHNCCLPENQSSENLSGRKQREIHIKGKRRKQSPEVGKSLNWGGDTERQNKEKTEWRGGDVREGKQGSAAWGECSEPSRWMSQIERPIKGEGMATCRRPMDRG